MPIIKQLAVLALASAAILAPLGADAKPKTKIITEACTKNLATGMYSYAMNFFFGLHHRPDHVSGAITRPTRRARRLRHSPDVPAAGLTARGRPFPTAPNALPPAPMPPTPAAPKLRAGARLRSSATRTPCKHHADGAPAAGRRGNPRGRPREGARRAAAYDFGLDEDRARARHLGVGQRDDVRPRRADVQPAGHPRPRGLQRGHLSNAVRGRRRRHVAGQRQGRRAADPGSCSRSAACATSRSSPSSTRWTARRRTRSRCLMRSAPSSPSIRRRSIGPPAPATGSRASWTYAGSSSCPMRRNAEEKPAPVAIPLQRHRQPPRPG